MPTVDAWRRTLRDALRAATRARDADVVAAMRETLAAIDNAEAVDAAEAPRPMDGPIAGAVAGLGAGEVARRTLTPDEVDAIVAREVVERREAAASYRALGRDAQAAVLERQAAALAAIEEAGADRPG